MPVSAKVIADSVSLQGYRLTTFELRYPKFIHGETKTHRVIRAGNEGGFELMQEIGFMDDPNLSRNASSSRAIPTAKYIEEVRSDVLRARPESWGKNQKGMQAGEELSGEELKDIEQDWKDVALYSADKAEVMMKRGAHKQSINRILEPYVHINVVASATEWSNFFGLRLHKDADPTMQALAREMWKARVNSIPKNMKMGEWHLPYITDEEQASMHIQDLIPVSVARCARVSYRSFETGKISTPDEDRALYAKLLSAQPIHPSPAEHQGTPDDQKTINVGPGVKWLNPHLHGNFIGWKQYRKTLPNEAHAPLPKELPDVSTN